MIIADANKTNIMPRKFRVSLAAKIAGMLEAMPSGCGELQEWIRRM